METRMFTVFDSAAGLFLEPFFCPSIEFAIREFRHSANREGSQVHKFPADYTLFAIGGFDPTSGKVTGQDPVSLGVAVTFIDKLPLQQEAEGA